MTPGVRTLNTRRDELLDTLLAVPLDRFVEERNQLARELRSGGDRETASWLAALRRPAPYVWALDQLARSDAQSVRTLTNMGRRLAGAQSRAMRDRAAAREMQELNRELQRAVDDAVRRATAILRDAGHGATAGTALSTAATLRAVLTGDDETRALLEQGRLLAPVVAGFGFGDGDGDNDGGGAVEPQVMPAAQEPPVAAPAVAEAAAAAAESAEREVFQRKADQRRADDTVAAVRERLQQLQAELGRAEQEARDAAAAVRQAVDAARAARREADRVLGGAPPPD